MKKILSIVCTIVLSLIIVSCAKDIVDFNGSISGVVKDKQDNSTIAGCQVTISPSNITKTTTEAGHFVFENIDAGDYTLSFVKEGYLSTTKDFSLVAGDKINTDVYLEKNKSMITASPEVLNFGDLETTKELFVSKVGSQNVQFSVKADADWISISPSSGVINNIGTKITVVVDRTNLSYGEYNSSITIVSSLGEVSVPVYLIKTEEAAPTVSNSGDFYDITETSMKVNAILSKTGGADVTAHGHCWSTKEEPTINDNKNNLGHIKEIGEFTSNITGLTAGETYYVRAYATNKLGTSYSNQMVITIPKIDKPIVKTLNADDLTKNSAKLHGTVESDGNGEIKECGFYYGTTESTPSKVSVSTPSDKFALVLTELKEGTTYYYKAYAVNAKGESCGDVISFITSTDQLTKPTVKTSSATDLTINSAKLHGTITSDGNGEIKECGFYYGTTESTPSKVSVSTPSDKFALVLTQLKDGTTYYYKAYAVNAKGESCGDVISFTTLADQSTKPTVKTSDVTDLTKYSAKLHGTITSDGNGEIKECGFYYGTTESTPSKVSVSTPSDNFALVLTQLKEGTTYYYKAYAVNAKGESCGDVISFTTFADQKPIVKTLDAVDITPSSATLKGDIIAIGEGKNKITKYGFYVGENEYQMQSYRVGTDAKLGEFEINITKLDPNKEYYYQAYVETSGGSIVKDEIKTFTTAKKPYISYALFEATKIKTDNSYYTKLWVDFTATAETYGRKIKDAGFVIGFTYERQDATLRNADIIVKGSFSESTSTYSGEVQWSSYSGGFVRAYFVLEDGTEIYTPSKIREGRSNYLSGEGATIEYKSSGN